MFRLKKDHALKYSKVLLDYFKVCVLKKSNLTVGDIQVCIILAVFVVSLQNSPKVPSMQSCWTDSGKYV